MSKTTLRAAMSLATSSCNPAEQETRSITNAFLRSAVPTSFVTTAYKPAKQKRRKKSFNIRSALAMGTIPR
jgi:hypothetical protein